MKNTSPRLPDQNSFLFMTKLKFNKVRSFYKTQSEYMLAAADKHLKDVAEWNAPNAGMFLWIKLKARAGI